MVSSCQGAPVDLFRTPPHRSTTLAPRWYTQQAPPSSCRREKFSAKASRTASKPALTCPPIRMRCDAFIGRVPLSVCFLLRNSATCFGAFDIVNTPGLPLFHEGLYFVRFIIFALKETIKRQQPGTVMIAPATDGFLR